MKDVAKNTIMSVLDRVIPYVKEKDSVGLKDISDETIAYGSIFQDEDSISIAVVTYALSKIIERCHFQEPKHWKNFHQHIVDYLKSASASLKKNNVKSYRNSIKNLFDIIENLDNKLALYIQEVVEKAKIKKGSLIYEHGISLSRVSELLGISNWELMNYVGNTQIIDSEKEILGSIDRLNFTRKIFGLK